MRNSMLARVMLPLGCILLAGPLGAAEKTFTGALKFRAGYQVGDTKDHLNANTLGFGAELGINLAAGHRLGLEVGWAYKPGKQYLAALSTMETAPGRTLDTAPRVSVDSRKNELKGLALRLSYQMDLTPSLGLQGGIQAGGSQFRQEYFGDVRGTSGSFRDVYNGTPTKGTPGISPYVGFTVKLDDISQIEINLVALRYTSIDYVHVAGVNTSTVTVPATSHPQDRLAEASRTVPHIEIGYALRF